MKKDSSSGDQTRIRKKGGQWTDKASIKEEDLKGNRIAFAERIKEGGSRQASRVVLLTK